MTACYAWTECIDLNDCWVKSGEDEGRGGDAKSRARSCERKHPAAVKVFHAWDDCARRKCEAECPRGPEDDD
jgi:hypothetical protein